MHFLLFYEVTPDYLVRRGEYRAEHLALAWQFADRGELLLGGRSATPSTARSCSFAATRRRR